MVMEVIVIQSQLLFLIFNHLLEDLCSHLKWNSLWSIQK
jgi:hypothetical protein